MWPRSEDDYMEIGETDLVPVKNGFIDKKTGNFIDHYGRVYNTEGELIYEPESIEDDNND